MYQTHFELLNLLLEETICIYIHIHICIHTSIHTIVVVLGNISTSMFSFRVDWTLTLVDEVHEKKNSRSKNFVVATAGFEFSAKLNISSQSKILTIEFHKVLPPFKKWAFVIYVKGAECAITHGLLKIAFAGVTHFLFINLLLQPIHFLNILCPTQPKNVFNGMCMKITS